MFIVQKEQAANCGSTARASVYFGWRGLLTFQTEVITAYTIT